MLMRSEPFTEVNRLAQQLFGATQAGTWTRPTTMPVDAVRNGDELVIAFDLPGVNADGIDIDVERNVLTVRAERRPIELGDQAVTQLSERPLGVFSRQLFLGEALDTEHIDAAYENGVLVVRIPIAEKAKPRKVAVAAGRTGEQKVITG
ncbi:Hsp20/alpha crystallin family protein [Actinoplanes sp. M2I2]|uniref:Hsp20/alpha crystallin family protein n=1 Tax=Actinoplanes sp. M2I2 TaxID=1734444 RepID=UPI0020207EF8|nr:Hsp20/alpha crystallin family protein [Actinoplanes sp. M2I2]